jgi:hypothetical protein
MEIQGQDNSMSWIKEIKITKQKTKYIKSFSHPVNLVNPIKPI